MMPEKLKMIMEDGDETDSFCHFNACFDFSYEFIGMFLY
jgi:hypothetical protein